METISCPEQEEYRDQMPERFEAEVSLIPL